MNVRYMIFFVYDMRMRDTGECEGRLLRRSGMKRGS